MKFQPPQIQRPRYEPFIANHFPQWHARREQARMTAAMASYAGGVPTRTSEQWSQALPSRFQNAMERAQLGDARSRSYSAFKNNLVARTLINTEDDNVIGDGLNYQPTTDSPEWNREAVDQYWAWLDGASVRGGDIHTGCELPRLLWNRSRVGGDVGWILVSQFTKDFRPISKIQVVQAEKIITPDGLSADLSIVDGIRFDALGAPTTFHVLTQDERTGARDFVAIPARDFVYLPHLTEANQARGEPALTPVLPTLDNIEQYVDGVALAAWMATVFGIVFKQSNSATQIAALESAYNGAGNLQKVIRLENGSLKYIGTDDEVAQVQAHQPMQQTPDFIRAMLRLAGMVFGMPLEAFARDMSTCNFASARIGLLPFYRACRIKGQGTFGPRWSRTIRWWLSREKQRADDDPKKWKTEWPENYWSHDLLSNAWEYTDPVSEAQGDQLQVDAGHKSPQMVIAERGRDAERIIRERLEWAEKTSGLTKVYSTLTRPDPKDLPQSNAPTPTNAVNNSNGQSFRITE